MNARGLVLALLTLCGCASLPTGGIQRTEAGSQIADFRPLTSVVPFANPRFVTDPLDANHFFIQWSAAAFNYFWTFETATNVCGPWIIAKQTMDGSEATVYLNGAHFIRLHGTWPQVTP